MSNSGDQIAEEILRDYQDLSGRRSNFEIQWNEIAQRVNPVDVDSFQGFSHMRPDGQKQTEMMFDSTASIALGRFSAILDSLLTPRTSTWHRLVPSNPYLAKNREVKLYFEEATRILFKQRYSPAANYAAQNQQVYTSLGAYGTGAMFVDELFGNPGLRYKNVHIGELYLTENHQGVVDHVIRKFALTTIQAIKKFGSKLPANIAEKIKTQPNQRHVFFHCVKPRQDVDSARADYKSMPYAAYYVAEDGKKLISEEGYNTFPYAISRYKQSGNSPYGYSPSMECLPSIKTLNEEKKTILKQGHRAVDPILLAHDDGIVDSFSFRPGSINAGGVSAEGRELVKALPVGNIAIGKDLMDDERIVINDAFLVTLFQIMTESPQMTATEVLERSKEKGILLAPTIGRQHTEYLGPKIEREMDLLSRQQMLPPMPGILKEAQGEYNVEYDSPLSRAQRAEEASGLMRTIETVLNVVNISQNLEPLDHFNWDAIVPEVSEIQGVPTRWMRDARSVIGIRQGRAAQQETQEMIQAAPAAAAMKKADAVANKGRR